VYAIVKTGGKQYRVQEGQRLLVERLPVREGAELTLEPIMYRSAETVLDKAGLEQVKVTAKVIEHVRGEKLRVLKFKPKRGYKRRTGHRQELTRIEVGEIKAGAGGAAGAKAKQPAKPKQPAKAQAKASAGGEAKAKASAGGGAKARPRPKAAPAKAKEDRGDGA
jgi:large subunit ribosomal protein L21